RTGARPRATQALTKNRCSTAARANNLAQRHAYYRNSRQMYQDNPCAIGGFLPTSMRCHQTVMYTIAPQFTCVTWRILLMRSAASQLLISFSTSISLPLNIVIFIVERFSWTPRNRNRQFQSVKT